MVGAPHVDQVIEPAGELVDHVGAVGPEVRVDAVRTDHHAILVVAEVGRTEPHRAVGLVRVSGFAKALDRGRDLAAFGERGLGEVGVEPDPEPVQRSPDLRQDAPGRLVAQPGHAFVGREVRQAGPLDPEDVPGQVRDVVAVVPVLREGGVAAQGLQVSGLYGGAEPVHLAAGVVEVVLALDVPAGEGKQPGQGVADDGVPRVADRERPGGVRRDELHLEPPARAAFGAPERGASFQDRAQCVVQPRPRQEQVDEPGPGDLDVDDQAVPRDLLGDGFRELARRHAGPACQDQGEVRGPVAVLLRPGAAELGLGQRVLGQAEAGRGGFTEHLGEPALDHDRQCTGAPDG